MSTQRLMRAECWTWGQIDMTPAQFRASLPPQREMSDVIKLAIFAGKKMADQLARAGNTVANLDRDQIESWRRRYGVPKNRTRIMLSVAWSKLHYPKSSIAQRREKEKPIGMAAPRKAARQMLAQYGSVAEKVVKKLARKQPYWKLVLAQVALLRAKQTPQEKRMTLARQGAAQFCSYLAKQQRGLKVKHRPNVAPRPAAAPTVRLLPEAQTYTPTLCATCEAPVPFGGTIFCNGCQPRKERS